MAWAIHCGQKGKAPGTAGYAPWWVADLRQFEKYGAARRVKPEKYIWEKRALVLMEAESRAYDFEPKTKPKGRQ